MTTTPAPTPTAIPGVTSAHLRAILDGPSREDWIAIPTDIAKALPSSARLSGISEAEQRAANDRVTLFFSTGAAQCKAARELAEKLDAMSDAEKAMVTADQMQQIAEQVVGYRNKLTSGGISETAAEHMTMQLHNMMMVMAMQGGQQKA